jgi:hypothetical protein
MGISGTRKLVPFGLVVSIDEKKERFHQIFESFFEIMKKEPKTIISDEDTSLIGALKDFKFGGFHLLDTYHILKNVKKNLKVKNYFKIFSELCRLETADEYEGKVK